MDINLLGAAIAALLVLAPLALQLYLHRLPVAPECPACRAVTRQIEPETHLWCLVPVLAGTSRGECARCGWQGRMRWKWATRSVRHGEP